MQDDSGLGNSDSVLHLANSKPPLPPNTTMGQRVRSRSIGIPSVTLLSLRSREQRWSRDIDDHDHRYETFSAPK